jgi:acyl-CoA thioester hydrolase|tara:strand:- start:1027 stop:1422 length:396 start_codon:yes stop_codon:yes gene_type:complete
MKCNDFSLKVFVEDTDFQGFVYHANYLKYLERARTQFLIDNQISQLNADGFFVIKNINITYSFPARLEENLLVKTDVQLKTKARMIFNQTIENINTKKICCEATIEVCFLDKISNKPKAFNKGLLELITHE